MTLQTNPVPQKVHVEIIVVFCIVFVMAALGGFLVYSFSPRTSDIAQQTSTIAGQPISESADAKLEKQVQQLIDRNAFPKVLELIDQLQDPETKTRLLYDATFAANQSRRYEEALPFGQRLLEIAPDDYFHQDVIGYTYVGLEKYDLAIIHLKKAVSLDSAHPWAHNNLGIAYSDTGQFALAEKELRAAIELDKNYLQPYNNLAYLYEKQGNLTKAASTLELLTGVAPDYLLAFTNLGRIFTRLQQWEKAASAYDNAIQIAPGNIDTWFWAGYEFSEAGQEERAIGYFAHTLEINPRHYLALVNLGSIARHRNNFDEAEAYFMEAIHADPSQAEAYFNLGTMYGNLERYAEAVTYLEKVKSLPIDFTQNSYYRGIMEGVEYYGELYRNKQ